MIELAKDDFLGLLQEIPKCNFDGMLAHNFDLIEDAGDFTSDQDAFWACEVNDVRYYGRDIAFKYDRRGIPVDPPEWATHIYWYEG